MNPESESLFQIHALVQDVVAQNVATTQGFGHEISAQVIQKEIDFCISFIESLGGSTAVSKLDWDTTYALFTERRTAAFSAELQLYFDQSQPGGGGSRNWYNVHWNVLQSDLLRRIIK